MKSDFLEFIGNARQRRTEKFRNQLYIFAVCMVLSVFIWALVRLSKDYYYSADFRLTYTQVPVNLKLVGRSDTTLNIKIKVQGFELFSEQFLLQHNREIEVSLQNVRLRYNRDHIWGYLLTSRLGKEIITQTNFPGDDYYVSPDTLFFEFEKPLRKGITTSAASDVIRINLGGKDTVLKRTDSLLKNIVPDKSLFKSQ
jgi:hypothetical protein